MVCHISNLIGLASREHTTVSLTKFCEIPPPTPFDCGAYAPLYRIALSDPTVPNSIASTEMISCLLLIGESETEFCVIKKNISFVNGNTEKS